MKNNLNKIVAGLCALTMIPCLSVYAENASSIMSAKAASSFIVNDENNTIEFNKEITVTISPIQEQIQKALADDVTISTKNNQISGSFSGLEYINKISFIIYAKNTSSVDLKENAKISGKSILKDGKEDSASFSGSVFECKEILPNTYRLDFCTGINGDEYSFKISGLNKVDNLSVESYIIENKYYKVEATYPDGEGICAYLPDSEGLNDENITKWAKNQCLLANSLKHLTGIKGYDTVYYYFNGSSGFADAGTISWKNSEKPSGRIRFTPDATKEELDLIKLNGNNYNFFTMHELGHVYGFGSKFRTAFQFDTYEEGKAYGNDEYYTNVRALTALQNCENIKDHTVIVTNMNMTTNSNNTYPIVSYDNKRYPIVSYNEVYSFDNVSDDNHHYHIARGFIKACDWNWNKLETFYRAEGAPNYNSPETINAADKLVDTLDISNENYNAKRNSILHFVNMLRWLYIVSTDMDYNEVNFINFIDETFAIEGTDVTGLDCITKMLIKENICPIILKKQPQSAIAPIGSKVKTEVIAVGEGLSFQWYACEPGKDEFIELPGQKEYFYSYDMTKAEDGRKVYCVITDKNGNTVTTDTVTLGTVVITEQPSNVYASIGGSVKTSVKALGNNLSYQWYVKNPGQKNFSKSSIIKPEYVCPMTEDRDGREIYCVITDEDNNSIQTKTVILKSKVRIVSQPMNTFAEVGEKVEVTVKATGYGLEYDWYKYVPGADVFVNTGQSGPVYSVKMSEGISGLKIYCKISDENDNIVYTDTVTLRSKVAITQQPTNVSVKMGQGFSTAVTATGDGLTYQWYYKEYGEPADAKFKKSSITTADYTTVMNKDRSGRQVYCVITDKYGNSVQTNTVTLKSEVAITKDLVNVTAKFGEKVNFSVSATGHGLTYKWYFKNKNMKNFEVTETFKTNEYGFDQMTEARAGREVYCEITDIFGNTEKTETIKIDLPFYGDANCDGKVTVADANAIIQAISYPDKFGLSAQGEKNADVSGDNGVTIYDAELIKAYDAKLISSFPASEQ